MAAKALTASYFGEQPRHSYFNGCSNGGRQAQMEVQRYPEDFDGIIAGDPATGTPLQVGRVVVFQQMLLQPEYYLPQEKVELLSKAASAACDVADGLKDGLVSDPRLCAFTPESLTCSGADGPNCLTQPQVEMVKKIYAPVKLPDGQIYAHGLPMGHEGSPTGWQAWTIGRVPPAKQADGTLAFGDVMPSGFRYSESNVRFLGLEKDDPAFNWKTFKFPQDLARIQGMAKELSPLDPNLDALQESRRQDHLLPRVGRSRDQRLRHHRLLREDDEGGGRSPAGGQLRAAVSRARDAPLQWRPWPEFLRHAACARSMGRAERGAHAGDRDPHGRWQSGSHQAALPLPAGVRVHRQRQHRRCGELPVRRAEVERRNFF